jgi:probable HAF family extracellular repeat protein
MGCVSSPTIEKFIAELKAMKTLRDRNLLLLAPLTLFLVLVMVGQASAQRIITFDAPGADTTPNDFNGTFPTSINIEGVVAGYYVDSTNVYHGFLRSPDGKFISLDAPGADTTAQSFSGTVANGINDLGEVTGYYIDVSGLLHGFLRSTTGKFTSFDVPGAAGFSNPVAINLEGAVVGYYEDANSQFHAFLRKPNGTIVSFDGPNACETGTPSGCYGSAAFNINIFGTVAASYGDDSGNFVNTGLIRSSNGKLTTYQVPGAGTGAYQGTGCPGCVLGLNASGAIAGIYTDTNNVFHGFLRSPEGEFTTFDAPGAGTASSQGTGCPSDCAVGLNDFGEITGNYIDASFTYHGFFRSPDGKIQTIDPPGTIATVPDSINELGVVAGYYLDTNNVNHGFLRIPSQLR